MKKILTGLFTLAALIYAGILMIQLSGNDPTGLLLAIGLILVIVPVLAVGIFILTFFRK